MSARLSIVDPGLFVSVQDGGRRGFRSIGVPLSGALDPVWLAAANALAGNAPDAPALEIRLSGPSLRLEEGGPVCLALVGQISGEIIDRDGERHIVPAQTAVTLKPGESFRAGRAQGTAYLAVSGGFRSTRSLGSYSTFERAGLGGIGGRAPQPGDSILCSARPADAPANLCAPAPPVHASGAIRFMPGPQDDHFEPASLAAFCHDGYVVSPALDRMGMRLEGPALRHNAKGADIVSDAVVPGVIQCPANGQPIILLADGQTTGGYAKIGCVIRADLPRLAHLRPGDTLHFAIASRAAADAARRAQQAALAGWISALVPSSTGGRLDSGSLLAQNLISGVSAGEESP